MVHFSSEGIDLVEIKKQLLGGFLAEKSCELSTHIGFSGVRGGEHGIEGGGCLGDGALLDGEERSFSWNQG